MPGAFNPVVAKITARAVFGRKRALLSALPVLVLILVTILLKLSHPPNAPWPGHLLGDVGFSVILPLTALIIGTSVLGAEIDDGSVVHLLATPVRRSSVIVTKYVVGTLLTMALVAVGELIAAVIASGGVGRFAIGVLIGALTGSVIYNAVFVMVSVLTTRAIAVGLLYVLVWEVVLGNFVSGARILSVEQYSLGVANSIARDPALNAGLNLRTAVIMGVIVTALALVFATRRLSRFSLKGDAV
jgi:ABC-2 type transport system permease protein